MNTSGPGVRKDPQDFFLPVAEAAAELQGLRDANANSLALHNAHQKFLRHLDAYRTSLNGKAHEAPWQDAQPLAGYTLEQLLKADFPEVEWEVLNLVEKGATTLFFGASYTGKSLLAWHLALLLSQGGEGRAFLDHPVTKHERRIALFLGENSHRDAQRTLQKQLGPNTAHDRLFVVDTLVPENQKNNTPQPDITTPEGRARYESTIRTFKADLAILDNLMSLAHSNLKDSEIARSTMLWMKRLSKELNLSWIIVEHTRKASSDGDEASPLDQLYGAHEWGSLSDAAHHIAFQDPKRRDSTERIFSTVKVRNARPEPPRIITLDENSWTASVLCEVGSHTTERTTSPEDLLRLLENAHPNPVSREELAAAANISDRTLRRTLDDPLWKLYENDGRVSYPSKNRKGSPSSFLYKK